jgi:predicted RNA-binding Zn-ribbon protein involved in translation (DUF1610 family)
MFEPMFTVVRSSMDSDYVREVLGHGGVNVFPSLEGTCGSCGVFIRGSLVLASLACPNCGQAVTLHMAQTYSDWSYERSSSVNRECRFIETAAKASMRRQVIPVPTP